MEQDLRDLLIEGARRLGATLQGDAVERFATYLSLLQRWGGKINLTSRLGSREIVSHHFLDSLAGARQFTETRGTRVIDLGAGAGLPAFPLKFAIPELQITLVDSVRKKIAFCQEVIRATSVLGMSAVWGRAEEFAKAPEHRSGYHWVVSRALGQAADVVNLALPFLVPGGRVLLYKGSPDGAEVRALDQLCERIGAGWELQQVEVPSLDEGRSLILVKIAG